MKRILIVEDDDALRGTLADQLSGSFEVLQAADGEDAVTKVVDGKPDMVLLDLMLPKLDGFKVLERIRQYPDPSVATLPVVVLSNLWSQKDILQVQGLHIEDYFVKAHTDIKDVIKKVKGLLNTKTGAKQ